MNKLESESEELKARLKELLEVEPDDDIIFLIEFLSPIEENIVSTDLEEFIDNPTDFSKNDIRILPVASNDDFQEIINRMKTETDKKVLKKYLEYLRRTSQIRAVPIYFQLIDNELVLTKKYNTPYTLGDLIVPVIEGAYNHHFIPKDKAIHYATKKVENTLGDRW